MSKVRKRFDFVVIGAGVAGLSAAYFLSQSSKVAVVEREFTFGYHTSGRSAAVFIEAYDNETVSDLSLRSRPFFMNPPAGFSDCAIVKPLGGLTVFGTEEVGKAEDYLARWSRRCPELHLMSATEAIDRVHIIKSSAIAGAIFDPNLLSIDTHRLLHGFLRGIRRNKGEIFFQHNVRVKTKSPTSWQVQSPSLTLETPVLINASGAWSNQIAQMAGVEKLPLTPSRRTAVIVEISDALCGTQAKRWPMVRTLEQNLYFKFDEPGLFLSPQDETPSDACDAQPEEIDVAIAIENFQSLCETQVSKVLSQWAGLRSITPDRCPLVGPAIDNERFFWVAGQGGAGFQTSPAIGEQVAATLLRGDPIQTSMRADRFAS